MNRKVIELARKAASEWESTDAYGQAATIIKILIDELKDWNDALENPPTSDGEYLCVVEYDFDNRHYKIKNVLLFSNGTWPTLGRATDIVTYWMDLPDDPV